MSSADWEEVKRLAADFQRAQLASSIQRLSERNCVELMNKLNELNLLKVHYTIDGSSFVTSQHLCKEIMDELYVAGGRINLVDLSTTLCMDLSIIEVEVALLLQSHKDLKLLLGQIISSAYELSLAEGVNEKLLKDGLVTVEDLVSEYQLPELFIKRVVDAHLNTVIQGVQDPNNPGSYYTHQYLSRVRARVRGALTAVTVPTLVSRLRTAVKCSEHLFVGSIERLLSSGRLKGELTGGKYSRERMFVPLLHSRTQRNLAANFLAQNGYLEYEFVQRLGIDDPVGYIRAQLTPSTAAAARVAAPASVPAPAAAPALLFLPSAVVGRGLLQQVEAAIDEALATHTFVDVTVIAPSSFSRTMIRQLIDHCLDSRGGGGAKQGVKPTGGKAGGKGRRAAPAPTSTPPTHQVVGDVYVVSAVLVAQLRTRLDEDMQGRGNKLVAAGGFKPQSLTKGPGDGGGGGTASSRKEERRKKAAGGKSGGGTQGRETKTRSTKSKRGRGRGNQDDDSDNEESQRPQHSAGSDQSGIKFPDVEYLPVAELAEQLSKYAELEDAGQDLVEELAEELYGWSKKVFSGICEQCYQSLVCAGGSGRKQSFQQMQERVLALLTTCKLAEKGIREFGPDLQQQLSRHLLRTHAAELLSELTLHLTHEYSGGAGARDPSGGELLQAKDLTPEARLKLLNQLPPSSGGGCRDALLAAHRAASVTGTGAVDLAGFFVAAEEAMQGAGVFPPSKKKDNKKDRQLLASHRAGLLEQLSSCVDAALCLHLSSLVLFYTTTGHVLHASGKFVPHVLAFLKPHLTEDMNKLLHEYQGLVIQKLTAAAAAAADGNDTTASAINGRLEELTPRLQAAVADYKKTDKKAPAADKLADTGSADKGSDDKGSDDKGSDDKSGGRGSSDKVSVDSVVADTDAAADTNTAAADTDTAAVVDNTASADTKLSDTDRADDGTKADTDDDEVDSDEDDD